MEDKVIAVSKKVVVLLVATVISVSLVILTSYTKYIFAQDFQFRIEGTCNPETETCYVRDCDDYCPPNQLANYNVFIIPASEYDQCENNTCDNLCQADEANPLCEKINCSVENGNDCTN